MSQTTDSRSVDKELPSKPLIEAIFEMKWNSIATNPNSFGRDAGYSILLGKYHDFVAKRGFTLTKDLPIAQMPEEMAPQAPRYQFWTGESVWPVTQLGPGIMTVNSTSEYKWSNFRELINDCSKFIFTNYPNNLSVFKLFSLNLKYINSIPFNIEEEGLKDFLKNKFKAVVNIDKDSFSEDSHQKLSGINMALNYKFNNGSIGKLNIGDGLVNGKPSFIWTIEIHLQEEVPQTYEGVISWLDKAHEIAEKWFFELSDGPLLESFRKKQ